MLYILSKTRTGLALTLKETMSINLETITLLFVAALASTGFAAIITEKISWKSILIMQKINYRIASVIVLLFLLGIVFLFSGFLGIVVAITAFSIAFTGIQTKVKRSLCMCFLMVPAMLFYLGISF